MPGVESGHRTHALCERRRGRQRADLIGWGRCGVGVLDDLDHRLDGSRVELARRRQARHCAGYARRAPRYKAAKRVRTNRMDR